MFQIIMERFYMIIFNFWQKKITLLLIIYWPGNTLLWDKEL